MGKALSFAGLTVSLAVRDRAAQLNVPGSVLAGASAARVLSVRVPDDRAFLYVGPHGRVRLPGVVAIHAMPERGDVIINEGLPTVNTACAVVEAALHLPEQTAIALLDRALQRGRPSFAEFSRRVGLRRGCPGYRRLAQLRGLLAGGERSELERRGTALLREAGITGWECNAQIRDDAGQIGLGDIVFRQEKLVLELDGWAYHAATEGRYEGDRLRQNRLTKARWEVARYTWRQVTFEPEYVVADVRERLIRTRSSDRT
jgi:very-short-patch-repair endonuclease